jgi:hypothetical protein
MLHLTKLFKFKVMCISKRFAKEYYFFRTYSSSSTLSDDNNDDVSSFSDMFMKYLSSSMLSSSPSFSA